MLIACQKPLEHLPNDNTGKHGRQIDKRRGGGGGGKEGPKNESSGERDRNGKKTCSRNDFVSSFLFYFGR